MSEELGPLAMLDVDGGNLGLDFANTINSRVEPRTDYLGGYDGLVAWAQRVAVLDSGTRLALLDAAAADPVATEHALRRAHRLRDAIYGAFSSIAAGAAPPPPFVEKILRAYGRAVGRGSLEGGPGQQPLRWPVGSTLAGVLDPVAYAAGGLLLSAEQPKIKECPGCGWLFLDQSRNGTRRWCDMRTCGSRDKMRRYYYKSRPAVGEPGGGQRSARVLGADTRRGELA